MRIKNNDEKTDAREDTMGSSIAVVPRRPNGDESPMRKDVFVYISGPMTPKGGYTIEENIAAGARVYWDLLGKGLPAFCPHLIGALPTAWSVMSHEQWLA